jgi:hypothetical protein
MRAGRGLGWPGVIFPVGGWGRGVQRRRLAARRRALPDLDDVAHQLAEARAGRFRIERLQFHLAGVPTYILAAELALHRVLRGDLPPPRYPAALRASAPARWQQDAQLRPAALSHIVAQPPA